MKGIAGVAGAYLMFMGACAAGLREDGKDRAVALPAVAAAGALAWEPPWADPVRHTALDLPARALHPSPSADGLRVAYATTEFGPRFQIALRDVSGKAPRRITRAEADHLFPRLSPDGRFVAYAANPDGNFDIFVARLDAPGAVRQITFEPQDEVAPAWSPDGTRLVYSSRNPTGVWEIVLTDLAGRSRTYLGPGTHPDWSPDTEDPWICFQSLSPPPSRFSGIWKIRPDGTQLEEIVAGSAARGSAVHPRFSPDGRWIAYATARRPFDSRAVAAPEDADELWAVRADGTLETRWTEDAAADGWPAWAGDRLFFVSGRAGGRDLWSFRVKPLEDDP